MANTKKLSRRKKPSIKEKNYFSFQKLNFSRVINEYLGIAFILLGFVVIFVASAKSLNIDFTRPFVEEKTVTFSETAKPSRLYIPKLSRVFDIYDGTVVGNRWTIAEQGVSYLTSSARPGEGNSVIYGHNRLDIFGYLYRVKGGDRIYLVESNGSIVKYEVAETKEITPTQVEILNNTSYSRLTIYTCSGFLDSARFVVLAKLVDRS